MTFCNFVTFELNKFLMFKETGQMQPTQHIAVSLSGWSKQIQYKSSSNSISKQDQNNYSDTEMRALSSAASQPLGFSLFELWIMKYGNLMTIFFQNCTLEAHVLGL